jgi:hypothetical protein
VKGDGINAISINKEMVSSIRMGLLRLKKIRKQRTDKPVESGMITRKIHRAGAMKKCIEKLNFLDSARLPIGNKIKYVKGLPAGGTENRALSHSRNRYFMTYHLMEQMAFHSRVRLSKGF